MIKRIFDGVVSLVVLVLFAPIFVGIALCIMIADGRPVIFCQRRVGRYGHPFTLYKFRTMTVDKSAQQGQFDAGDGRRVTPVGQVLRKTKLDELPQFFNVLLGHMSVVGPRPEIAKWTVVYPERWQRVLSVRPGITDNAAIIYRNEEALLSQSDNPDKTYEMEILPHKLSLYEDYINRQNLWLDVRIIGATALVILGKPIYKI